MRMFYEWLNTLAVRTRQASKRSIRHVVSIWTILELRIHPRRQTSVAAFMRARATAAGGCAAGHVPPSPILICVHTSFRSVAKQCLSCVQINHRARGSTLNCSMISRGYPDSGTVARKNIPGHYWSFSLWRLFMTGICRWHERGV